MEIYFHAHLQQFVPCLATWCRQPTVDVTTPSCGVIIAAEVVMVMMVVKVMVEVNPNTGIPAFVHPVVSAATASKEKGVNSSVTADVVTQNSTTVVVMGG